ncbi:MAG: TIGR04149 family rSAM-modified RiPP [Dysgonamonadaceae bacterium]|jgi:natural product precursor|nr:TIGR04149 family rSAM-modified RiPP [Dysgonamonadaceae bacterium]
MKKINLKEISKIMSESEMKDVKGGNGGMDNRYLLLTLVYDQTITN